MTIFETSSLRGLERLKNTQNKIALVHDAYYTKLFDWLLWWRQTVYELYILMVDTPLHVKLKCVGVFDITSGMGNKVPGWNNTAQERGIIMGFIGSRDHYHTRVCLSWEI